MGSEYCPWSSRCFSSCLWDLQGPPGEGGEGAVLAPATATPGALYGADSYYYDSSPSFCPCACCRNKGMRTRLGCLSHKSDSCSDFTAILPDKPNRALKWVIWPHSIPGVPTMGCPLWDYTASSSLVDGWTDESQWQEFPASWQLLLYLWTWMKKCYIPFRSVWLNDLRIGTLLFLLRKPYHAPPL